MKFDRFVLKPRQCFCCGRNVYLSTLQIQNSSFKLEDLVTLWQDDHIEIYCCSCYNKAEKMDDILTSESCIIDNPSISRVGLSITLDDHDNILEENSYFVEISLTTKNHGRIRHKIPINEYKEKYCEIGGCEEFQNMAVFCLFGCKYFKGYDFPNTIRKIRKEHECEKNDINL